MSDEHITSLSSSNTPYDFRSILADFVVPEHRPSTPEQDSSTPDSDVNQEASTPATSSGTVIEDNAIQYLLSLGYTVEQIIECVENHKGLKKSNEALEIISGVGTEELPGRIRIIEARLLATVTMPATIPMPATVPTSANAPTPTPTTMLTPTTVSTSAIVPTPDTVLTPATIPTPMNNKRELSEAFDEEPSSSSQDIKRPRTDSMDGETTGAPQATNAPLATKISRRGCPGDKPAENEKQWKCNPEDLLKRECWTSFKKFRKHFEVHHLQTYGADNSRWQCSFCSDSFAGPGYALIMHIWVTHFV
ncbi:hypothetical protein BKA58DRAFT_225739 [Alternaria rosae]|uniref:uncharacterized protein n=1 Tax=Alternaria rosae TaxID=1187941 RepID=UPI001E8D4BD3|nr:uncharacterized protein BKA58DRAFT_225739 [Alternaria rosae]KAH6865678.1 hypothetical protein BKA58DRAFT_225739 [Alternaria rosae]